MINNCENFSLKKSMVISTANRTEENMKLVAFELARNYLESFTNYKKSQVALVLHDEANNENNFVSKFVFVEHKPTPRSNQEKEFVYFRICVPLENKYQPYMDVFCPFSPCLGFSKYF